jgi:transcriptional regulator with XRE-family HTH domain
VNFASDLLRCAAQEAKRDHDHRGRRRQIRRQQGLSLQDVEARTGKEFKASVLGAYERGERTISVPRLMRLAAIYSIPPDQLLPRSVEGTATDRGPGAVDDGFTVDLIRLGQVDDADARVLARYVATIQLQRQDFNGRMLTIRRDDLRVLAAVVGRTPDELVSRLDDLRLRAAI